MNMVWNKLKIPGALIHRIMGTGMLFLLSTGLQAQTFETGINYFWGIGHSEGFEPGSNGFSLDLKYHYSLDKNIGLNAGMEAGISGWGFQILFPVGFRYGKKHKVEAELLNGMALYQQGSAYVFGAGLYYVKPFFEDNKHQLILSFGLRYTIQPAYREYSPLYAYIDLPLRIRWGIQGKRAPE